jgi:molybdopterin converting factor subunit 1
MLRTKVTGLLINHIPLKVLLPPLENTMKITLLAFGIVKEILQNRTMELELPEHATTADLKTILHAHYPALQQLAVYRIAVNGEYSAETAALQNGDEVAIIPPVSGG